MAEQHLYNLLLIHSTLSYAGVAEWRPGKLAAVASDTTTDSIIRAGQGLQAKHFIYVDEDTEEVFVRSFVRHDGLLKQFRLPVSMANDYTNISSPQIRKFFIHELRRLFDEYPEYKCWEIERVKRLLKNPSEDMRSNVYATPYPTTYATPYAEGYGNTYAKGYAITPKQGYGLRTATATATATSPNGDSGTSPKLREADSPGMVGTRIPSAWSPGAELIRWAQDNTPNVDTKTATQKFRAHYASVAGRAQFRTDWGEAWKAWLLGDQEKTTTKNRPTGNDRVRAGLNLAEKYRTPEEIEAPK